LPCGARFKEEPCFLSPTFATPDQLVFMTALNVILSFSVAELERQAVLIATRLGRELERRGWLICTAESCTGGAIARALTETGGSSAWFDCAYITYSNRAKMSNLGVLATTLEAFGAVSEPVVAAMASGALERSHCQLALAVSGVAGPSGGSAVKPVGTVCFAWALAEPAMNGRPQAKTEGMETVQVETVRVETVHIKMVQTESLVLPGDRYEVRLRTVCYALLRAEELVMGSGS
jgi:nicotinamide-nucleotide amidase